MKIYPTIQTYHDIYFWVSWLSLPIASDNPLSLDNSLGKAANGTQWLIVGIRRFAQSDSGRKDSLKKSKSQFQF